MKDIHARNPVNKLAAIVTSPGPHYDPQKRVMTNDSDLPIATRFITDQERAQWAFVDLTGRQFGRFVVIGKAQDYPKHWVVRCGCGRYSTRTSKAIKNRQNKQDRCEHCRHFAYLRRNDVWRRTGKDVDLRGLI